MVGKVVCRIEYPSRIIPPLKVNCSLAFLTQRELDSVNPKVASSSILTLMISLLHIAGPRHILTLNKSAIVILGTHSVGFSRIDYQRYHHIQTYSDSIIMGFELVTTEILC